MSTKNLKGVAAGAVIGTVLWLAGSGAGSATESGDTYTFSDVTTTYAPDPVTHQADPDRARIIFTYAWSGNFPGTELCTFIVRSETGEIIGSKTADFTGLEASDEDVFTDVAVNGLPASASIGCADQRRDDPTGHFQISEVSAQPRRADSTGETGVRLKFRGAWSDTGTLPAPQRCDVKVYGSSGNVILSEAFLLTSRSVDLPHVHMDFAGHELPEEPASAEVNCDSFRA